ncbi:tetratricopeptide repeat protein [bacterium]|nr:tetratricopeptide repeat protein [bacterium]
MNEVLLTIYEYKYGKEIFKKTMLTTIKRLSFSFLFSISIISLFSQSTNNCLKDYQLIKMTRETKQNIQSFLSSVGYEPADYPVRDDQMVFKGFQYEKSFSWSKGSNTLVLITKKGFPNIICYDSYDCFDILKESKIGNVDKGQTTGEIIFNFDDGWILVFNNEQLKQKQLARENKINDKKGEMWELKSSFESFIIQGENFIKENFLEEAKSSLLSSKNIAQKYIFQYETNYNLLSKDLEFLDLYPKPDFFESSLSSLESLLLTKERNIEFNQIIEIADSLFGTGSYISAIEMYERARPFDDNFQVDSKIEISKQAKSNVLTNSAEAALLINDFDAALDYLKQAINYSNNSYLIENKIKEVIENKLDHNLASIEKTGDSLYQLSNYEKAILTFEKYLLLKPNSPRIKDKLKKSYEIKNILFARREKVFDYRKTNEKDFFFFRNKLSDDLREIVVQKEKGLMKFDFHIKYDTFGNNNSFLSMRESSIHGLEKKIIKYTQDNSLLPPTAIGNYFIASTDKISYDLNWLTYTNIFKSNYKGIVSLNKKLSTSHLNEINSYLSKNSANKGKFIFKIKEKEINGNTFTDISLISYKVARPRSAIYSLIMPGMGTLKVSYGEKGWGRLTCFLLSSAVSVGAKLYSDQNYERYLSSTNIVEQGQFYEQANIANKIFLGSATLSATIYTYDFFWVISKGIKNLRSSKTIRKRLRHSPIPIQSQDIDFMFKH